MVGTELGAQAGAAEPAASRAETSASFGPLAQPEKDRLADADFAFPQERKEPLIDAAHVRNAIARFDQVEGVTDEERDRAWKRILTAADKHGVHVSEHDWRELFAGGKERKR
jgi:hypothetical protein